jgi:hypothetical protein
LVGTIIVDSIGVGLAAFGFLNPLLTAFIHVSSEMTFILNSARLLPPISSSRGLVRGLFSQSAAVANCCRCQENFSDTPCIHSANKQDSELKQ